MIPPVSGRESAAEAPARPDADGSSSCARRRSRPRSWPSSPTRLAVPEDGAVVGFLGRTRSTPGTPAPGQEAEAARHAGRSVESLEYEAHDTMALRDPGDDRRRDRGRASGSTGWRSSIAPARCRSASRRSRSWPSRRTAMRPSRRPATRSTRRRRARRSGRPSGSPTGTSGSATRHGPAPRRRDEGLPERRHGGHRRRQPPGPDRLGHARYPAAVDLMVGETNAAIEGALAGGADDILVNDSHGGMFNLLPAALHPAARVLQGQKAWSMVEGADRTAGFDVALFVGYHARAGHPRGTIAHTYSLGAGRDPPGRPADRRVRPQRDDPRGVGHPGRPGRGRRRPGRGGRRAGCRGRSGSWSRRRSAATRRPRSTRPSPPTGSGPGAERRGPGRGGRRTRAPAGRTAGRHRGRLQPRRRGGPRGDRARAPNASAIGASGSASDDPAIAYRGFLAGNRLASIVDR